MLPGSLKCSNNKKVKIQYQYAQQAQDTCLMLVYCKQHWHNIIATLGQLFAC